MRGLTTAWATALFCVISSAQSETPVDPRTVPPDVFVTVHKDPNGADLVDVRLLKKGYPLDVLQRQCEAIGTETGSEVRGLYVFNKKLGGPDDNLAAAAQFGCNNLIDRNEGELNLEAIVKAFVGAPKGSQVASFLIVFDGEKPTGQTLRYVRKGDVRVEAADPNGQPGIEYRVVTLTQDPAKVHVPRNLKHKEPEPSSTTPGSKKLHPAVIPLLAVGVVGAGVLVYLGLRKEKSAPRG